MTMLQLFDRTLNSLTMYKGILYGLLGILVTADVMAFAGLIGISGPGLLVSVITLSLSCFVANKIFARLFKAPTNSESWLITALILACIVAPKTSVEFVLLAALCGVIAMASKYVLTWHGSHIFNPAAVGAFAVSVTGLLSVNWWVATPWLTPVLIVGALVSLRRHRKFTLFTVFAGAAIATMLVVNIGQGQPTIDVLKAAIISWPLIFMGSIMLTEPTTLPAARYNQLLVAAVVGVVFASQQSVGAVYSSPQVALLIGNLFAFLLAPPFGAMFRLKQFKKLAPTIYELTFNKPKRLQFLAGQYMEWTLPHQNTDIRGNRRSFSIASAPSEDTVKITIRTTTNGSSFKRALVALKTGAHIRAANISGEFVLPTKNAPLLFIAGGIGITPFRSMISELLIQKTPCNIQLLYTASSSENFVYKDLLDKAQTIGVRTTYSVGRLDDSALREVLKTGKRTVYISGPDAMVRHYEKVIRKIDSSLTIHKDHFSGY